jgi:hypothetical protein
VPLTINEMCRPTAMADVCAVPLALEPEGEENANHPRSDAMSNIVPYSSSNGLESLSPRSARALSRSIANIGAGTELAVRRVEAEADKAGAKLDAIDVTAGRAQILAAMRCQREQQLAAMVPLAATTLEAISQSATIASIETVMDLSHKLRRI